MVNFTGKIQYFVNFFSHYTEIEKKRKPPCTSIMAKSFDTIHL
jgi:hypothetical protein